MNNSLLFQQVNDVRQRTMNLIEGLSDSDLETVPDGFRNNLKWHLGHLFTTQETLLFKLTGENGKLPEHYGELFSNGTSPLTWGEKEVPDTSEIIELLKEQPKRLENTFSTRLDESLKKTFKNSSGVIFSTVEDIFHFSIFHEGFHHGYMTALKRVIK